ncbi:helicase-related protein [Bacillus massilinigeriensis]|uniref:helicase-related protein n=1 Tax=Bacillus massilionigeriensis TaxID=1805475 RepID=UPI00096B40FB|nr:helicase-related protein [Bacillus massilionigeriensis]
MNKDIIKSLSNREAIIGAVSQEIIGPGNIKNCTKELNIQESTIFTDSEDLNFNYYWIYANKKEEVIQRDNPSRRYGAGMLYPMKSVYQEEHEDELIIEVVSNEEQEEFYAQSQDRDLTSEEKIENSGLDDATAKINQNDFIPSTMGLTFCLEKSVQNIIVKLQGGVYSRHKIYANFSKKGKRYKFDDDWWLRKSVTASKIINISEFINDNNITTKEFQLELLDSVGNAIRNIKFCLHVQCRFKDDYILMTITALNRTKPPGKRMLDEYTLFQSELTIIEKQGGFLNYPKVYQRNLELTEDEWNSELLFKNKSNYAFGHGCSATWEKNQKTITEIKTTFIPTYETESMTPNIYIKNNGENIPVNIKMSALMNADDYDEVHKILYPLVKGYNDWIHEQQNKSVKLPKQLRKAAKKNLDLCNESLKRIEKGLVLLKNPHVLQAFKFANKAVLLQQINGKQPRNAYYQRNNEGIDLVFDKTFDEVTENMKNLDEQTNSWRAFQIAFILLSIQSVVKKESMDRKIVDLIWFPTGGGKTEAYLGVASFQMFYRRILDPNDAGVDIIMRYTLRLLTADQFQRASRLICAMEFIRRENSSLLGYTPYSIGIWVGTATSPNNNKEALTQIRSMSKSKGRESLVVTRCPWCGCHIGKVSVRGTGKRETRVIGFNNENQTLIVKCPDELCDFSNEIPVYFVDETIYEKRPTFLIGTIDKFVQLTWRPEARSLFGIDKNGQRMVSPPQIIVQDELHLISGPLGTLAGLYEVLIEELCIDDRGERPIYPKIISATATIKEFEEQAKCLFGRENSKLFPSPGIDIDDSFFSKVAKDNNGYPMPGRKYVGVFTSRVRILMAQVMTYSAILQKVESFTEDEKDPFWTLLSFYNSLRDLGAGLNLFNSDIPTYIDALVKREDIEKPRFIGMPLELTSRKQSGEISKTIDDLKVKYESTDNRGRTQALTACLASNIIEVGVDIDRLSLMGIVGQPKMTAQYIQVSGRVGRRSDERPGLIVTIYSNQNSRDKSHFEHFNEYHQRLYAQVETTSLTPFSTASLDRGLTAVIIGFLRQRLNWQLAISPSSKEIQKAIYDQRFNNFKKRFKDRVELIDSEQLDIFKADFQSFINGILKGSYETWVVSDNERGLMYYSGNLIDGEKYPGSIPVINSLRSVDAESKGSIIGLEHEVEEFVW